MNRKPRDTSRDQVGLISGPMPALNFFREFDAQRREFQRDAQWGGWTFDKERLVLWNEECPSYEIDVETCTSSQEVLDWFAHVGHRYSPDQLGYLVRALDDLLGFRQNLLKGCQRQEVLPNVRAHLKREGWLVQPRTRKTR